MYSKCIFADNSLDACYNLRYLTRINLQQLDGALSDLSVVVKRSPSSRVLSLLLCLSVGVSPDRRFTDEAWPV